MDKHSLTERYVTTVEAARQLRCSDRYVRMLISDGRLHAERIAALWLIDADSLRDFVTRRSRGKTSTV
jgi:excisionase family DNA binding protein